MTSPNGFYTASLDILEKTRKRVDKPIKLFCELAFMQVCLAKGDFEKASLMLGGLEIMDIAQKKLKKYGLKHLENYPEFQINDRMTDQQIEEILRKKQVLQEIIQEYPGEK